jgi:general secretion pathway protein G
MNSKETKSHLNDVFGGWTFIETLVVIAIALILTGMIGFAAIRNVEQARRVAAQTHIETYSIALNSYYFDNKRFPSTEQGLDALWEKPVSDPVPGNWNGPYLTREPDLDPWDNPYSYENPGPNGLPFAIISFGADGLPGGEGNDQDISSWE